MNAFVKGVQSLFSGPDTSAAKKQSEEQSLVLAKQAETLQNQDQEQQSQLAKVTRVPRGRRLLLAATGEQGVSSTLGG
ncbi:MULTISPECIES: hypothetical protein [Rhodopseudomonas]|uniref:Uncharacterized protein n=1 Tax=Rhodopseudomonas palustris TaxID=1076 RepID=A0A0D7F2T0_RHOPL|nr:MULTISPECIES: hypothetical protein [Rhodopseudomonas]KIZ47388.1 hypothetical protein OO17_04580 [Rhodopseudomonas palustris]MDF3809268.1 hypothetical protein [Rhodopseudomonas sp. BAL398]WOK19048.1 hypothetical protein RBJ75_05885 [Rhodopseudomonas sp. BAL398]